MPLEIPITDHPKLPDGVPLIADFHDDRNRLSYYYPIVRDIDGVRTPVTAFFPVEGSVETYPDVPYREITRFMQDICAQTAFVRGDFSSGKYEGETGSKIESQDRYDIQTVVLEMMRQLARGGRHLGGRIAVREWVPHDREVRYFIRDGDVVYRASTQDGDEFPDEMAELVTDRFETFAWSVDFIRHETTGKWYLTDMGLDGLRPAPEGWIAISGHLDESYSPEQYADEMADPHRYLF